MSLAWGGENGVAVKGLIVVIFFNIKMKFLNFAMGASINMHFDKSIKA